MAAEVWVATAPIWLGNVRAYNLNNVVPDSVVAQFGLESAGLVERRPASDTGVPSHGVDPATQAELDNAIGSRAAVSDVFAGDGKFRADKLPSVVPRTINGKTATGNGDVVLTSGDIGALPVGTTAADIGALPVGTTAASLGALPSSTTARDIGGLDQLLGDARYPLKGAVVFNVRDYGAKGDNVTNDTTAIQAAIDAAAAKGGIVFLPTGVYRVAELTMKSLVTLQGAGREATTLKLLSGANTNVVTGQDFATLTTTGSLAGIYRWAIRDLLIDGNKTAQTVTSHGIAVYGYDYKMENVYVYNCRDDAYLLDWDKDNSPSPMKANEAKLTDCIADQCGGNGFNILGGHDTLLQRCNAIKCAASGFWVHGSGGSGAGGTMLTDCHGWGNEQQYAFRLDAKAFLNGGYAEGAQVANIAITAGGGIIEGTYVLGAGATAPVGIKIGDTGVPVSGWRITANVNDCTSGALALTNDAGNWMDIYANQPSGSVLVGNAHAESHLTYTARGLGSAQATEIRGSRVYVRADHSTAFTVKSLGAGQDKFSVNTAGSFVEVPNATAMRGFSDNYVTKTWELNGGRLELTELAADPAAPPASRGTLYMRDNGAGKTQLVVRFPTGAIQVVATEP